MPTYEYHCDSCDQNFDVVQSFHDDALTACPTCGSPVRKVFGNVGIVFKGSGFYKTDSRSGTAKQSGADAGATPSAGTEGTGSDSGAKTGSDSGGSSSGTDGKSTTPATAPASSTADSSTSSKSSSDGAEREGHEGGQDAGVGRLGAGDRVVHRGARRPTAEPFDALGENTRR